MSVQKNTILRFGMPTNVRRDHMGKVCFLQFSYLLLLKEKIILLITYYDHRTLFTKKTGLNQCGWVVEPI